MFTIRPMREGPHEGLTPGSCEGSFEDIINYQYTIRYLICITLLIPEVDFAIHSQDAKQACGRPPIRFPTPRLHEYHFLFISEPLT